MGRLPPVILSGWGPWTTPGGLPPRSAYPPSQDLGGYPESGGRFRLQSFYTENPEKI